MTFLGNFQKKSRILPTDSREISQKFLWNLDISSCHDTDFGMRNPIFTSTLSESELQTEHIRKFEFRTHILSITGLRGLNKNSDKRSEIYFNLLYHGFWHLIDQGFWHPVYQGFWHPIDQGFWHPKIQFCRFLRNRNKYFFRSPTYSFTVSEKKIRHISDRTMF